MGRGVNVDDIFFCGFNDKLQMASPERTLETVLAGLLADWKPTFLRLSLAMATNPRTASWLSTPAEYAAPMTHVIRWIGTHPGVYVMVTLRSDTSMIGRDEGHDDPEATGLPSDATTSPDRTRFPAGTDATYQALVDAFARDSFVLFGLTNEPGGDKLPSATIAAAMTHAVSVIRTEEDRLGVPHHLVAVQGNNWTSDVSYYATSPLREDGVVYEVHGYPPKPAAYTYANLPIILGEYGTLGDSASFYADVEAKQIPNLAWDFEPYSNCGPDMVTVTKSATDLTPTAWGLTVKAYLLAGARQREP
jgi:Cellulase (glycosyl hydrolase family 5)